jgi:signal transduction histidine kinase
MVTIGAGDFRRLFDAAPGPYLVLAPDLTIVEVNEAYLAATMTVRETILGRKLFEMFPDNPDDRTATGVRNLTDSLTRVLRDRRADRMAMQKYDIRRPDGSFEERYWSPVNVPVLNASGEIDMIIHHVVDVTDYARQRQHAAVQSREVAALRDRTEHLEAEIFVRAQELQRANDELRKANAALAASQAKLMRQQRMEAVGQLTGGVAHDFNNLLTVVLGSLDMLERSFEPNPQQRRLFHSATQSATRGAQLTSQLLAFARQQSLRPEVLDVNAAIHNVRVLLKQAVGDAVDLVLRPEATLWPSSVDVAQLQSALLNLALNARDAMPNGGRLTVATACHRHAADDGDADDWAPGDYAAITVSDTGRGMSLEVRERAFEPFFTTKDASKGAGLGLSQVYGFAKQSGGHVTIESVPGDGTSVTIYLPRAAAAGATAAASPTLARAGGHTVLVVEDDDGVRQTVIEALAGLGYSVLAAGDGREAIAALAGTQHIDLVFTDVVMPQGVSGIEVAKEAVRLRKGIKVLLSSGYPLDVLRTEGDGYSDFPLFPKPYRHADLAREIRRILADG